MSKKLVFVHKLYINLIYGQFCKDFSNLSNNPSYLCTRLPYMGHWIEFTSSFSITNKLGVLNYMCLDGIRMSSNTLLCFGFGSPDETLRCTDYFKFVMDTSKILPLCQMIALE